MHVLAALVFTPMLTASGGGEARLTAQQLAKVRGELGADIPSLIEKYQLSDALDNDGRGRSDATTSGGLGWGESGYLRRYMMCYFVTQDTYWLDKVVDHFDRMLGALTDHDGDGMRSWQDIAYSAGLVDIEYAKRGADLSVSTPNGDRRVYYRRGGEDITGHDYALEFSSATRYTFSDTTDRKLLGTGDYTDPTTLELLPGSPLKISGTAQTGDKVLVRTRACEPCEYQVHDGMVTYPVAQFIEHVRMRDDLDPRYRAKADEYLDVLHRHFVLRWEKTWREVPPEAGVYVFSDNPTQRFPGYSLPHNQYLAPARTCLVLSGLGGYEGAALCAERARKMAAYFKRNLELTDTGAYVWNYWDPLPGEEVKRHVEDCGHGTIDIGFALEAVHRGVVFTHDDLKCFASTYVDVMWDGNAESPSFGSRVDTNKGGKSAWWEWIQLAEGDVRVWDLAMSVLESKRRPADMGPPMAWLWARLAGVEERTRKQCRENSRRTCELVATDGVINPSFEVEAPTGEGAAGWSMGTWGPDSGESVAALTGDAYRGQRALCLTGRGETVNVWAMASKYLAARAGDRVTITAFYKAGSASKPSFSILGDDETGERAQYATSPAFPVAAEWREARWTVAVDAEVCSVRVMLRNHGSGAVLWDEVVVRVESVGE